MSQLRVMTQYFMVQKCSDATFHVTCPNGLWFTISCELRRKYCVMGHDAAIFATIIFRLCGNSPKEETCVFCRVISGTFSRKIFTREIFTKSVAREIFSLSCQIKPNLEYNYTFAMDFVPKQNSI